MPAKSGATDQGNHAPQPMAARICARKTISRANPTGARQPRPALAMKAMGVSSAMVSPAVAQYWTDMLQAPINGGAYLLGAQNGGCSPNPLNPTTTNPVLAIFDLFCGNAGVETTALQALDLPGAVSGFPYSGIPDAKDPNCAAPGNPACRQYHLVGGPNAFYNPQYVSLFALRSIGFSNYNALQASLRHRMSHGIQFDFNYTYSKSIDLCSDAERAGGFSYMNFSGGCQIFNAWSP